MNTKHVGSDTLYVPLSKLDASDTNVRRTGRDEGIEELAALIASQGLLQALGVTQKTDADGQPTGRYAVNFGARRFAALQLLAKRKTITKAAPISCRLVPDDQAAEMSLAENSGRIAMHPADLAAAFAALFAGGQGLPMEKIGLRFGVSLHTVKQRLRLASVSPIIIDAFRADQLTLDEVSAFTIVEDHAQQEQVLKQQPSYMRSAHSIRRALTQNDADADDFRVRFVGVEAYEAAGGTIRRDLFSEDDGGWFIDTLLLDRLAFEKLEQVAEEVRVEGWAWVEAVASVTPDLHRMRRVYPQTAPISEVDEARLAELQERYDAMEVDAGASDADVEAIEAEIDAIESKGVTYRPEDIARAGALVTLGRNGAYVERGILRADASAAEDEEGDKAGQGARQPAIGARPEKTATLPAPLMAELVAARTAGLQAEVATRPHLALCILIEALASRYSTVLGVRVVQPPCPAIEQVEARKALQQELDSTRATMPTDGPLLPWLVKQDATTLLRLLAPLIADGVDGGTDDWTAHTPRFGSAANIALSADLDMTKWWKPTIGSYLSRISKSQISAAVAEGTGQVAAKRLDGLKKEAMVEAAAGLLEGRGWLPSILRPPGELTTAQIAHAAE